MDSKSEAEKICNKVEELAKNKLSNKEDILQIIQIALEQNNISLLEDLSFNAKFTQGLLKIIRNRDNSLKEEYFENLQNEYSQGIQKVKSLINELFSKNNDFIKQIFDEKYFQLSQQGITNLNSLCRDLNFLKIYLNDLKRLGE